MKYTGKTFSTAEELPWETVNDNIKRQIIGYDDLLTVVRVRFDTDAEGSLHSHPHSQISCITEGRFEINIAGEKKIMKAGDGYYVAPDLEHGLVCLDEGTVIDIFSPVREDFVK